jgi:hypothetical protein
VTSGQTQPLVQAKLKRLNKIKGSSHMKVENPLYKLERLLIEEEKSANKELNESNRSDAVLIPKIEIKKKSKKQAIE